MEVTIRNLWDGTECTTEEGVTLRLRTRQTALVVEIDAPFHGDPPPPAPAGRCPGLWDYEVVELFLVGDGPYLELEFGPYGHWLGLQLASVRNPTEAIVELEFEAKVVGDRWKGEARVDRRWLPPGLDRWNAFSIHGVGQARRYLAASPLPGDRPDFHQPEFFPRGAAVLDANAAD